MADRGLNNWGIFCCFPRYISRKLDWKRSGQVLNQHSYIGYWHCKQWFILLYHKIDSKVTNSHTFPSNLEFFTPPTCMLVLLGKPFCHPDLSSQANPESSSLLDVYLVWKPLLQSLACIRCLINVYLPRGFIMSPSNFFPTRVFLPFIDNSLVGEGSLTQALKQPSW